MKPKALFDISEDVTGLALRRRSESPIRNDRRIICLDTSSCFADITQVIPGHFKRSPATAEDLNSGIHGHMYSRPTDLLVVRPNEWLGGEPTVLTDHLLNLNAEIWRSQTGISLLTPNNGTLSSVAKDETMLETAVNLFERDNARTLIASSVTPRMVSMLKAENTELDEIARSCDLLNHKNSCLPMLRELGIRVPWTLPVNQQLRDVTDALDLLHDLPNNYRYVFKADGSSGGVGVYTNGDSGYDSSSLRQLVAELMKQCRLPARFQIQEFVRGTAMGALGTFDGRGHFHLLSVHMQGVVDGVFKSGHWRRAIHDRLAPRVTKIYECLATAPNLNLKGPVGIDFVTTDSEISVLEVNARFTGSGPIAWLLSHPAILNLTSSAFLSSKNPFEINSIDLVDIELAPGDLGDRRLLGVITKNVAEAAVHSACKSLPMILPQGLDPCRPSKLMFVNDQEGMLKRAFCAEFPQKDLCSENVPYVSV